MKMKIVTALGAILLLAFGTAVAEARNGGGWGGGGGGGPHFGGGGGGGPHFGGGGGRFNGGRNFSGRSFRSGPNFGGGNFRGYGPRGPRIGINRGFRNYSGNYGYGRGRHHHRRGGFVVGYPYYDYGYYDDGYYGYDCGWLYQRAIETGSPYWWRRYQACVY
ncbi:hypothetical protein [Hyphomicrobium sp. 99]|uniref:hypothetical protein n=1 Tax=Hyphomicrobium sp. 99 TaxID=1163419 RepID=UPI0018CD4410|nr:hypothetical protein [Hyphomicrobium sp. 99]